VVVQLKVQLESELRLWTMSTVGGTVWLDFSRWTRLGKARAEALNTQRFATNTKSFLIIMLLMVVI
jgi:hypothetical protein